VATEKVHVPWTARGVEGRTVKLRIREMGDVMADPIHRGCRTDSREPM
jgi:hypothetical protein